MAATNLLQEFDFREANVPEKLLVLSISAASIEQGLADAALRFATIASAADGIQAGDFVRISYPDASGEEQQAQFTAGRHFFDPSLEDALLGMTCGQITTLTVRGQTAPVTVCSVKRRYIPPLTDAEIASLGIEGVGTIGEYRQHLIQKAVRRMRMQRDQILTDFVQKQTVAQSVFSPVDRESEEYCLFRDSMVTRAGMFADQREGVTADLMLRKLLGLKEDASEEESQNALDGNCDRQVKLLALGRAHAEQDGAVYTLESVEADLRAFAKAHGMSYENLMEGNSLELSLLSKYIEHYGKTILAYYEQRYTVAVE